MTLTDTTVHERTDEISFEFDLAHSPGKVWRALTEPDLLGAWLLPVVGLELVPGATFTFEAQPQPGWDGIVHCQVVEIEPQQKLVYRWVVGSIDTVVKFTIEATDSGTRLSLVQSGFKPDQKQNRAGARYGWRMMGGKLIELLERND